MSERFSRRSRILGLVLLVAAVGVGGVLWYLATHLSPWFADRVAWTVNRAWGDSGGFRVEVGGIRGFVFGEISVTGIRFEHWQRGLCVSADTLRVDPALLSLLRGRLVLDSAVLVSPDVRLLGAGEDEPRERTAEAGGTPPIELRRVVFRDGTLSGGPLEPGESFEDLDLEGFFRARSGHLALRLDSMSGLLSRPPLRVDSVTGWLTLRDSVLRPKLSLETSRSSFTVDGEVPLDGKMPSRLRIGLGDLSLDEVSEFEPRLPPWVSGWVSGALYLSGTWSAWDARLSLQGQVSDWPAGEVRASIGGSGEALALTDLAVEVEGTRLTSGRIRADVGSGHFEGAAELHHMNLGRFARALQTPTDLDMGLEFSGSGFPSGPFTLDLAVERATGRFGRWTLDEGHGVLEVQPEGLRMTDVVAEGPGWTLSARGTWPLGENLEADLDLDLVALEDIGGTLGRSLGGTGEVRLALEGTPANLGGRVSIDARDLHIEGTVIDTLLANLSFVRGTGPLEVRCFLDSRGISRGALSGQKVVSQFRAVGRDLEEFHAVGQADSVLVQVEGRMTNGQGALEIALRSVEISSPQHVWVNEGPVTVERSGEGTRLHPARWRCGQGTLDVAALIATEGPLEITAGARAVRLESLADLAAPGVSLDGVLDLNASISGTREEPRASAFFAARLLRAGTMEIERAEGALDLGPAGLRLDSLCVEVAGGRGKATGQIPVEFAFQGPEGPRFRVLGLGDVNVEIQDLPLDSLLAEPGAGARVSGRVDLSAAFSGRPEDPRGEMEILVDEARLGSFDLGRVRILSELRDRSLVLRNVDISSGSGAGKITGTVPLEGKKTFPWVSASPSGVNLDVLVSQGRFTFLPYVKSSVFRQSDGVYDMDLTITGSLADPALRGTLEVTDGRLLLGPLAEELTDVRAAVAFDPPAIRVTELRGNIGGGSLTAGAQVTLDSLRATDYRVEVDARRVSIASLLDEVRAVADVRLRVRPDTTAFGNVVPRYSGSVDVFQAEITRGFPHSEDGGSALAATVAPTYTAELFIEAGNNVWVRNSDAEIELEGSVLYKNNAEGAEFLGDVQTVRGRYFLYNNEFRITSGTLEFADVRDIRNARLEIQAETDVVTDEGRERVTLDITGTLAKPQLAATSESGYSEPEIFRLLALGQQAGSGDEGTTSPFSRALARSWGQMLARRFGSELARSLGLDEVEIEPGPGEPGDREFVEGARVGVGKYVSDRLYLKYKQSLAVNPLSGAASGAEGGAVSRSEGELPDRQILLEYRLSRLFSLDGEASTVNGNTYYNFDVKFRHRY